MGEFWFFGDLEAGILRHRGVFDFPPSQFCYYIYIVSVIQYSHNIEFFHTYRTEEGYGI